jgi:hypothetical protein
MKTGTTASTREQSPRRNRQAGTTGADAGVNAAPIAHKGLVHLRVTRFRWKDQGKRSAQDDLNPLRRGIDQSPLLDEIEKLAATVKEVPTFGPQCSFRRLLLGGSTHSHRRRGTAALPQRDSMPPCHFLERYVQNHLEARRGTASSNAIEYPVLRSPIDWTQAESRMTECPRHLRWHWTAWQRSSPLLSTEQA